MTDLSNVALNNHRVHLSGCLYCETEKKIMYSKLKKLYIIISLLKTFSNFF